MKKAFLSGMNAIGLGNLIPGMGSRPLVLENPIPDDVRATIDGDAFADFFPRKVTPGTSGIVHFKSPIRWVANKHTLDTTEMVLSHVHVPQGKKANAAKVRLTGDMFIARNALDEGVNVFINELDFHVLADGNVVLVPIPDVSEVKVAFSAPKPRPLG